MKEGNPRLDKLVDATDIEGEKNSDVFEIARELESKFEKYDFVISIIPFGSKVKGYSKRDSDYDFIILIDEELADEEGYNDFLSMTQDMELKFFFNKTKELSIHTRHFNKKNIEDELTIGNDHFVGIDNLTRDVTDPVLALTKPGTGNKLSDYREIVRGIIKKLPTEYQQEFVERITGMLVDEDLYRFNKMEDRVDINFNKYLESREKLWRRRVEAFYL